MTLFFISFWKKLSSHLWSPAHRSRVAVAVRCFQFRRSAAQFALSAGTRKSSTEGQRCGWKFRSELGRFLKSAGVQRFFFLVFFFFFWGVWATLRGERWMAAFFFECGGWVQFKTHFVHNLWNFTRCKINFIVQIWKLACFPLAFSGNSWNIMQPHQAGKQ